MRGARLHKDTVVACVRVARGARAEHEVRTFSTTTSDLLALSEWLAAREVTHVAMEATGVHWKPVWHILEPTLSLVLASAGHVRRVPRRKTDVNDATWLSDLLCSRLIRASFVPDADKLALLAHRRLRVPKEKLREALRGRATAHHGFLLKLHLVQIDSIDAAVAQVDAEVGEHTEPFESTVDQLATIPGVGSLRSAPTALPDTRPPSRWPSASSHSGGISPFSSSLQAHVENAWVHSAKYSSIAARALSSALWSQLESPSQHPC